MEATQEGPDKIANLVATLERLHDTDRALFEKLSEVNERLLKLESQAEDSGDSEKLWGTVLRFYGADVSGHDYVEVRCQDRSIHKILIGLGTNYKRGTLVQLAVGDRDTCMAGKWSDPRSYEQLRETPRCGDCHVVDIVD